jgi:hypothetical protein
MGDKKNIWGRITPFTGTSRSFTVVSLKEQHGHEDEQQSLLRIEEQHNTREVPALHYFKVAAYGDGAKWWRGEGICQGVNVVEQQWYVFDACVWGPRGLTQWRKGIAVAVAQGAVVMVLLVLVLAAAKRHLRKSRLSRQKQLFQQQRQQWQCCNC